MDEPTAPNVPAALPGHRGPHAIVPLDEQRARRNSMSSALQQTADIDVIIASFLREYGMKEPATRNLINEVRAMWDTDDADGLRYEKSAQKRRILGHIAKATKAGKFTAVANLESTYASVAGTDIHADDMPIDVDARLTDAILAEMNALGTKEVRILIAQERTIIELTAQDGTATTRAKLKPGETVVEVNQE